MWLCLYTPASSGGLRAVSVDSKRELEGGSEERSEGGRKLRSARPLPLSLLAARHLCQRNPSGLSYSGWNASVSNDAMGA